MEDPRLAGCGHLHPGRGLGGMAEATSLDTAAQMNQRRSIVNMLHGVRDGLVRDAEP